MARKKKCPPAGLPAWVMTFADLMSLLMTFFILLLSFATMDIVKFKAAAGSLKEAFGDDLVVKTPGTLNYRSQFEKGQDSANKKANEALEPIKVDIRNLQEALAEEIRKGILTVEEGGGKISIQVQQIQSFPSGDATVLKNFQPILEKLAGAIIDSPASIHVDGHTDNRPIATSRYPSNWELSAARAASVARFLLTKGKLHPPSMEVRGHADSMPIKPNDSPENQAINRRIEIVMNYDHRPDASEQPVAQGENIEEPGDHQKDAEDQEGGNRQASVPGKAGNDKG